MSTPTRAPHYVPLPAHVRACDVRPPQWWDLGNKGNAVALKYCNTCPFKATCKLPTGKPEDQILAGVAYGTEGDVLQICDTCGHPVQRGSYRGDGNNTRCDDCRNAAVAAHHDQIIAMRKQKRTHRDIGREIGLSQWVIQHYLRKVDVEAVA